MSIVELRKKATELIVDAMLKTHTGLQDGELAAVQILEGFRNRWVKMCLVHKVYVSTTFYDFMRYQNDPTYLTETDLKKIVANKMHFVTHLQTIDCFRKWDDIKADCQSLIQTLKLPDLMRDLLEEEKDSVTDFYDQEITKIFTGQLDPNDEKNEVPVEQFVSLESILVDLYDEDDDDDDDGELLVDGQGSHVNMG